MINSVKSKIRIARRRFRNFREQAFPIPLSVEEETIKKLIDGFKIAAPAFFIDPNYRESLAQLLLQIDPGGEEDVRREAGLICDHKFDLLGLGLVDLGNKIPWDTDFKAGFRWPKKYYLDMLPIDPAGDAVKQKLKYDGKVPYELSRCQHFAALGQAYLITNDEKYAREFVAQTNSWLDDNPPFFGVNWTCSMEVAIRAANWIQGLYFFKGSPELSDQFLAKVFENLIISGRYIRRNLEKSWRGPAANHYLADIAGLVFLGIFLKDLPEGKSWRDFGMGELKKEMETQVYPDGGDYEASTCYHRLALEFFFFPVLFAVINDDGFKADNYAAVARKIFGQNFVDRFYKMFEVALYLLKPDGKMPQIGDNDNGQLFIFKKRDILDMRYLLCLGAVFFNEPKFKINEFGFCEDLVWVFGANGYKVWDNLKGNKRADIESRDFRASGWYVFRSGLDYCLVSCGSNGQNGNGGHCHNDKLSFELALGGKAMIIDAGTFAYTGMPEWRDRFRSTAFHNTVAVDGEEQNRISGNMFSARNDAKIKIVKRFERGDFDILIAEHSGYRRLKAPIVHRRIFAFNKKDGYLAIKDVLAGEGNHVFDLYFHPRENCSQKDLGNPLAVNVPGSDGGRFSIVPLETEGLRLDLISGWASSGYGQKEPAMVVKYSKIAHAPVGFITLLFLDRGQGSDRIKNELEALFKKL